jgi:uncharacterized delta-60 repeat protein
MRAPRHRLGTVTFMSSLALLVSVASAGAAAPGDLDRTFGSDGKVTTDFTGMGGLASDHAVQQDGKLVAAGFAVISTVSRPDFEHYETRFALVRYNPDGSLDRSFGDEGKVLTDFPGSGEQARATVLQPNGKIVVAGFANLDFALARYNPDGSLDSTFDGDGKVTTDFGADNDTATGLSIQHDGKLVAGGYAYFSGTLYDFALARYNPDGSLDSTFDGDGKVTTDFAARDDTAYGLVIQQDGKIVATGDANLPRGTVRDIDFALARYNENGSLDFTFDADGRVTTAFTSAAGDSTGDFANAVAVQRDGRIVASGTALRVVDIGGVTTGDFDFALARYLADGTLDPGLEHDGTVTTDLGSRVDFPTDLAIQSDQRLVVGGFTETIETGTTDFALVRYDGDGFVDTTYGGGDGLVTTDFNRRNDGSYSVAIQADGKIVAAGVGRGHFALARYTVCRRSSMRSSTLCPDTQAIAKGTDQSDLPTDGWIGTPDQLDVLGKGVRSPHELMQRTQAVVRGSAA